MHFETEALSAVLLARQYGYEVLSALLAEEPNGKAVGALIDDRGERCFSALLEGEGLAAYRAAAAYMRGSACEDDVPEGARGEFTRLFIGPGRGQVYPYESVYVTEEGSLFQECTLQVRGLYRRYGWQSVALNREPDDHLAVELDFMARLSALQNATMGEKDALSAEDCAAIRELLEEQAAFVREHLAFVVRGVAEGVATRDDVPFYRPITSVAMAFVESDISVMDELLYALSAETM